MTCSSLPRDSLPLAGSSRSAMLKEGAFPQGGLSSVPAVILALSEMDVFMLLSVPALVVLNGLFVAAEFSLVSVRKTRVEELVRHGVQGAKAVEEVISYLDRTIAATQLGV